MSAETDFLVDRTDLHRTTLAPARAEALAAGRVRVRIDRFAFTANNVTYGAVGDMIGYWKFFPADGNWGRIPVWGFGDVVESGHDAIRSGERLYGYFPMSTHVTLQPEHVSPATFVDASAHRAGLPPIYNSYTRVAADPAYDRGREAEIALFRPLFTTAFLLDDFFAAHDLFGARSAVLTSASSKTALGLAFLLAARMPVVGLTARRNAGFVRGTGYYTTTLPYEEIDALPDDTPAVLVDFAGNGEVLARVHHRLAGALRYSSRVGLTHWDRMTTPDGLSGPAPVFFFAPDRARERLAEWGPQVFQTRVADATRRFLSSTGRWLRVVEGRGPDAVAAVYRATLEGRTDPAEGHVLSL